MSKFTFLNVCLVLLTMVGSDLQCGRRLITCHAGMYAPGERGKVMCNLHVNMTACQLSVAIVHYQKDPQQDAAGTEIASCLWNKKTKNHRCKADHGYNISEEIDDRPTLYILSVDNSSAGFYFCYIISQKETKPHICKLTSEERPVCDTTPTPSIDIGANNEGCKTYPWEGHVVAHVIMALMITALVVTVVILGRRLQRSVTLQDTNSPQSPEIIIKDPRRRKRIDTCSTESERQPALDGH